MSNLYIDMKENERTFVSTPFTQRVINVTLGNTHHTFAEKTCLVYREGKLTVENCVWFTCEEMIFNRYYVQVWMTGTLFSTVILMDVNRTLAEGFATQEHDTVARVIVMLIAEHEQWDIPDYYRHKVWQYMPRQTKQQNKAAIFGYM